MISTEALIAKFQQALDDHWGYIWGTAGVKWTESMQKQKVDYMVSKYGTDWKKNADAKNDNYYSAALYGSKWIGHTVADCSGLFRWAFKQLGFDIAHGSNSIYDRYCSSKGKLTSELKRNLIPGTAVFTGDSSKHGHIGLYIGNGKVIEASGTQAGVCVSNITAGKWTYYGELKNVDYSNNTDHVVPSAPSNETPSQKEPTLKNGSKGDWVAILQNKLIARGYALPKYGADGDFGTETQNAVKQFQRDNGLKVDGIVGEKTWEALNTSKDEAKYTVTVQHVIRKVADEIVGKYGGSIVQE